MSAALASCQANQAHGLAGHMHAYNARAYAYAARVCPASRHQINLAVCKMGLLDVLHAMQT